MASAIPAQPTPPARTAQVIPTRQVHRWIEPWYIAYAILGALASGFAVILIPLLVTTGGGSATEIGLAIAAQNLGALSAPFWGWISDRCKAYRSIFFGGFALIAAGFLGFALFRGSSAWLAGAFLIGFGTGASNTVASLFVVEFTPAEEWGQRISWLQTFNALGSVLGLAAAGFLEPRLGTLISALLVIPAIIVGGWGLPVPGGPFHVPHVRFTPVELTHFVRRIEPLTASVTSRLHGIRLGDLKQVSKLLFRSFGIFLLGWFFFSLALSSFSSLYPVFMLKIFSMSAGKSSLLISVSTALSIPLYNLAGRLTTRRGPANVLIFGMVVRMFALAGLGLLGIFHPSSMVLPIILPVIVLFGLFQGIWPLLSVASNDISATLADFSKGTAIGLFNAAAAIASAAGAILGGVVADRFGYSSAALFAALGTAVALVFVLRLRRMEHPTALTGQQTHPRMAG